MAYTNNFNVWHTGVNDNIIPSTNLYGNQTKYFAPGKVIPADVFNGLLKDVSIVTYCILQSLINTTGSTDTFTFDNSIGNGEGGSPTVADALTHVTTILQNRTFTEVNTTTLRATNGTVTNLSCSQISARSITSETLSLSRILTSTDTTQTTSSGTTGAVKLAGGLYAAKNIRSAGTVYANKVIANGTDPAVESPTVKTNKITVDSVTEINIDKSVFTEAIAIKSSSNLSDRVNIVLSNSQSGGNTLTLPNQTAILATTNDITSAVSVVVGEVSTLSGTVSSQGAAITTLQSKHVYVHNISITETSSETEIYFTLINSRNGNYYTTLASIADDLKAKGFRGDNTARLSATGVVKTVSGSTAYYYPVINIFAKQIDTSTWGVAISYLKPSEKVEYNISTVTGVTWNIVDKCWDQLS